MKRSSLFAMLFSLVPNIALADPTPPKRITDSPASYPPAAYAAGIEGEVTLIITIGVDGKVTEAIVKNSAGFGFDEAALTAAKGLVFTPAMNNGAAQAAQIEYRYPFQIEKLGKKASPKAALLDTDDRSELRDAFGDASLISPPQTTISGELFIKGSRDTINNASLFFYDQEGVIRYEASAKEDGTFSLTLPAGEYTLRVIAEGFAELNAKQTVVEGDVSLTLRLVPSFQQEEYGLVVRGEQEQGEVVTQHEVSAEELAKMPGTQGDALKGLQNLPGVARVPINSSTIAVRGSSPEDTQTFLDGMPIPVLYHFSGITAVIPSELLSKVNITPGVYSVRYGRSTGGLIEAETTTKTPEKLKGSADLDVFDSGAFVQGPLGEKASFAIGARRSYIDAFLPYFLENDGLSLTVAPRFWDYQALVRGPVGKGQGQVLAFGSQDRVELAIDSPTSGTQFQSTLTRFHRVQGSWRYSPKPGVTRRIATSIGTTNIASASQNSAFTIDVLLATARVDWASQLSKTLQLRYGADMQLDKFTRVETLPGDFTRFLQTEQSLAYTDAGAYTELIWRPSKALTITPGLRSDYFGGTDSLTLDPRLFARWKLSPETTLKGGAGVFHKDPQPFELDPVIGDPTLGTEEAKQATLGVEQIFENRMQLDASIYGKLMSGLVIETLPGETRQEILSNNGEGRAYGVEFLLRAAPKEKFFGWLAYSLSRAERKDDDVFVPFDFDQTHVLTMLGSYKIKPDWSVGARFRYATGNPTTGVTGSVFDSDRDTYIPVKEEKNDERLPPFHQLDLRMDRNFRFDSVSLSAYLEILNVYNRRNPESVSFNFDFTQQQYFQGLPILPAAGIQGSF